MDLLDLPEIDEPQGAEAVEAMNQLLKRYRAAGPEYRLRSTFQLEAVQESRGLTVPKSFSGTRMTPVGITLIGFGSVRWTGIVTKVGFSGSNDGFALIRLADDLVAELTQKAVTVRYEGEALGPTPDHFTSAINFSSLLSELGLGVLFDASPILAMAT